MRTRCGGLGLALLLLAPGVGLAQPDDVAALRKELEALRAEVKKLRSELAKFRPDADQEKLVGAWEWVLADKMSVRMTFGQDGTYKIKSTTSAKVSIAGKYSVTGDMLKLTYKTPGTGGTKTLKIEKLNDAELAVKDEKGTLEQYKRVAPK